MGAFWKAVAGHLSSAAYDVLFVAVLSLMPLLLGRLAVVINDGPHAEPYWAFLSNGQLAFFSMGSLATLLLYCIRKKLPDKAAQLFGFASVICLLFLVALVVVDPSLQKGQAFVGSSALFLYIGVIVSRIVADAMKAVGQGDALQAGADKTAKVANALQARMKGQAK